MSHLPHLSRTDLLIRLALALPGHRASALGTEGNQILRAVAEQAATALDSVVAWTEAALILSATGGARATGTLTIEWANGSTEAVEIKPGQVIATTPWGVRFRTLDDTFAAPAGASPGFTATVNVEAEWCGFDGNGTDAVLAGLDLSPLSDMVDGETWIAFADSVTPAGKSEFVTRLAAEEITIAIVGQFVGGAPATLDLLAAERGLSRAQGEPDAALRQRIRTLPDVLTPAAILRAVNAALASYGVSATPATLVEPGDFGFAFGDDGQGAFGTGAISRPWHFVVLVPDVGYFGDGFAFGDDPDGAFGTGVLGGTDTVHAGIMAGLQSLVNSIRAAGIWGAVREVV